MPASIFAGSKVKALKETLSLNGKAELISTTVDPTSAGLDAPIGSIACNETTGVVYTKTGALSTAWTNVLTGSSSSPYQWGTATISTSTVLTAATYPTVYDMHLFVNAAAGSVSITLPEASTVANRKFTIKRTDNNTLFSNVFILDTIDLIDGQPSISINKQNMSYTFISNGSTYYII